jgi:hypothetical protein
MCVISSIGYYVIHSANNLRTSNSYIPQVYMNINA